MTPVTQALSTALLHFIWQGIAGGIVLAIALQLLRKSSASSRYVASCFVLAVLALSPVFTGWIAYQSSPGSFSRSRDWPPVSKAGKQRWWPPHRDLLRPQRQSTSKPGFCPYGLPA